MGKQYATVVVFSLLTAACASQPPMLAVQRPNDVYLACRDIAREIQEARYYKNSVDTDNRYSNDAVPVFYTYESKQASNAADKRIAYLEGIFQDKKCYLSRFSRSYQQQMTPLPPFL